MKFLTPTLLNSMDLQCGQQVEKNRTMERNMFSALAFRLAIHGRSGLIPDGRCGVEGLGAVPPSPGGLALRPRRPDLLGGSHVRLGEPDSFFCARNLTFVPFEKPFVHMRPSPIRRALVTLA